MELQLLYKKFYILEIAQQLRILHGCALELVSSEGMSFLNLDGGSGSAHIVERLVLERKRRTAKSVGFDAVDVDEAILQAAVNLYRDRQQQHHQETPQQPHHQQGFTIDSGRMVLSNPTSSSPTSYKNKTSDVKLEKLCINNCPANPFLEYLIEAAMGMDLFREFELQGNLEEEELAAELAAEREVAAFARRVRRGQEAVGGNNEHESNTARGQIPQEEREPDGNGGDENSEGEDAVASSSNIFALDALGFRMRFSRRLRKLELINLPIMRDHAESLMYGIETNATTGTGCRLDTLVMEGVRFMHDEDGEENDAIEDDVCDGENQNGHAAGDNDDEETDTMPTTPGDGTVVVKELCEGFPNNSTLKTIELQRCRLTDAQIALIFDSLANHPTLININLSENACRNLGLEALDRMLVSPQWMPQSAINKTNSGVKHYCKIESLDLGYQFTSEETYGTGEHIQLDILTRNCTTKDADIRIYPNLRKLVLQGNQIYDSDMEDLAFLIRHRFPRLEELDLRFNEITTEGLEVFANHSDPNNGGYITSNNGNGIGKEYKDHFPPPSSRLRTIRLTNNPLVMTNHTSIVILKMLKIYPELQLIQSNLAWEDQTPVAQYIEHLLDINRAGRVLLLVGSSGTTISDKQEASLSPKSSALLPDEEQRRKQLRQHQRRPIPLAAWPFVLARLTRKRSYPHYIPKKNRLNGMFYLIRHGPIVMQQMASRANKHIKNKNGGNGEHENHRKRKRDDPALGNQKRGDPALDGYETLADYIRYELGVKA